MLYFAYGSNMDWDQMRNRCPSTTVVGKARLPGYALAFTRKSQNRRCGVADVVPDASAEVWGVVFRVDELDVGVLDKNEGYRPERDASKNAYERSGMMVFVDGDDNSPLSVETYTVCRKVNGCVPNKEYRELLVKGAQRWDLPTKYIENLRALTVYDESEE